MPNYYVPGSEEYYSRFIQSPPSNDGGVPRFTNDPKFQEIARKALVDNFNGPMPVGGSQTVVPGGVYRTNKDGITFFPQEAITNTPLKKETKPRNTYTTVTKDPYANYRGQLDDLYNKVMGYGGYSYSPYTPSTYSRTVDTSATEAALKAALGDIQNYGDFSYDLNADMLYQNALDNYMMMGQQAMVDTTANAAALTGGYGNSYAASVGNQAFQNYITQANNMIPQFQQMALNSWQSGLDRRMGVYDAVSQQLANELSIEDMAFAIWAQNEANAANAHSMNSQGAFNEWSSGLDQLMGQYEMAKDYYATLEALQKASGGSGGGSSSGNKTSSKTPATTGNQVVLPNGKVVNTTPAVTNPYTSAQLEELLKLQNKK